MRNPPLFFGLFLISIVVTGCTQQSSIIKNRIDELYTIFSSDQTMKVYLEKEYNPEVQRFIRQSVILQDTKTGNKIILNEVVVSNEEALTLYTQNGCNTDKSVCCNSVIDFNEFEPIKWEGNEKIEVNQYFDNYECAGKMTYTSIYNTKGEEIEKWTYNAAGEKDASLVE